MKHTLTLLIALALGGAAAFANWFYLNQKTKVVYFEGTRVATPVKTGDVITSEHLEPVSLHVADDEYPSYTFLPFADKGLILNRKARRDMDAYDLILKSDIVREKGPPPVYEALGPFKVIAVGDQFIQNATADSRSSSGGDIITLAVDASLDAKTRRLIEILDPRGGGSDQEDGFRIVGVFVYPRTEEVQDQQVKQLPLEEGEVAIFVSLGNIQIVPKVLLVGDRIGFHVPKPLLGSLVENDATPEADPPVDPVDPAVVPENTPLGDL